MHFSPGRKAGIRESDQFIVSFPRSGNTWTRHLVQEVIVQRRPDLQAPADLDVLLPTMHKDAPDDPAMEAFGLKARILKSHNIRDLPGKRMVYVFREPADSLVSFYHHRQRTAEKRGLAFEDTIDAFCERTVPAWYEHMELGIRQAERYASRTYMLAYETLHEDTEAALHGVTDFLGLPATDEQVAAAVERASFGQLRAREEQTCEGGPSSFFYRKGRVGSAVEELSRATMELIDRQARPLYERALALSRQ